MPESPALAPAARAALLSPRVKGIGAALVTVALWTAFILVARASAGRSLHALDLATLRIVGAGLVLLPWGWWRLRQARQQATLTGGPAVTRSFLGFSPLPWRLTALAGLFGAVLYAVLSYSAFFFAPATHASVLMPGTLPLWTLLLSLIVLRDRISAGQAMGLALILAGGLMVGGPSLWQAFGGGEVWKGDLMFMGAAFCWASYTIVVRRHRTHAVDATIAIIVFAMFTFVPVYFLLVASGVLHSQLLHTPLSEVLFQLLFQGVGSVVISGIAFTLMIGYFGPVRSTMLTAVVPGLSALGAVFFLGEPLSAGLLIGLALVTTGILFGVRSGAAPAPAPAASTPSMERRHA